MSELILYNTPDGQTRLHLQAQGDRMRLTQLEVAELFQTSMYMRAFAEAWPEGAIVQQPIGQLPWNHQLALLGKLPDPQTRR